MKIDLSSKKLKAFFRIALLSSLVIMVILLWTIWANPTPEGQAKACFKNNKCVTLVGIMDTNELRAKGLMGHDPLSEEEAMLFVFPKPIQSSFWMKNMTFPIDIVWFNSEKRIVCVEKKVPPCNTENCPTYPCNSKAKYVIELSSGFADEYLLYENDKVEFKGTVYD